VKDLKAVTDAQGILLDARLGAAMNCWHLENRAIPQIRQLAGQLRESPLPQAVDEMAKAHELLEAAGKTLRSAIDIIERFAIIEP
jgi:hypothetical protein